MGHLGMLVSLLFWRRLRFGKVSICSRHLGGLQLIHFHVEWMAEDPRIEFRAIGPFWYSTSDRITSERARPDYQEASGWPIQQCRVRVRWRGGDGLMQNGDGTPLLRGGDRAIIHLTRLKIIQFAR